MFQIHYCEFSRQNDASDIIFRPNGSGDWLFLLFLAPMQVTFPDRTEIAQAGSCLLYSPQDYQNYHAVKEFRNSYIHFSCEEEVLRRYGLPESRIFYPSSPDLLNGQFKAIQALPPHGCWTKADTQPTISAPSFNRHGSPFSPVVKRTGISTGCAGWSTWAKASFTAVTVPFSGLPQKKSCWLPALTEPGTC